LLLEPKCFANAALDPISFHGGRSMLAGNKDAQPRRASDTALVIKNESSQTAAGPAAKQPLEFDLPPEPAGGIETELLLLYSVRNGYSASRRRPRARRLRNTLRPPLVRLRTRKPWRRARRVFEGW
jgi:hypothetical protein